MTTIDDIFEKNMQTVQNWQPRHTAALLTLDEGIRKTQDPKKVPKRVTDTLKSAGYETQLSPNKMDGFWMETDQRLNGKEDFGAIIPLQPTMQMLSQQEKEFFTTYAKRAGVVLDHARLYQKLHKTIDQTNRLQGILVHELKAPLSIINGSAQVVKMRLEQEEFDREKVTRNAERIIYGTKQLADLSELLYLGSLEKQEVKERSMIIDVEEKVTKAAEFYDEYLKEHNLGLELHYSKSNDQLHLNTNQALMTSIWTTLLGNSVAYAPEGSIIRQGIRKTDEGLEMIAENLNTYATKETVFGMGKGRGFPFIQNVVNNLGGSLSTSKEGIFPSYEEQKRYGSPNSTYQKGYDLFSTRVVLPLSTDEFDANPHTGVSHTRTEEDISQ